MDRSFQCRTLVVSLFLVTGLSALSVKLLALQILNPRCSQIKEVSHFKLEETIPARFGNIVDRHNKVLAHDEQKATLIADRNHLNTSDILIPALALREARHQDDWEDLNEEERKDRLLQIRRKIRRTLPKEKIVEVYRDYAASVIAPRIDMEAEEFHEIITSKLTHIMVKKGLAEDSADRLEEALQARLIQGFRFQRCQRRHYPMPNLAPHLIGIRDHQGVGKSGLEKSMDDVLSGRDGKKILKRNENGLVNLTEPAQILPPRMGKHVRITLDTAMQAIVEEELGRAHQKYQAENSSIVVVDPHTGDILAIASRPYFNLNRRENFENAHSSFAVAAQYEPGSVLKIVGMSAALDRGGVSRQAKVDCGWGKINFNGARIPDHHPYGNLSFDEVMMKSSNTGVFLFTNKVGQEGFEKALRDFGFGQKTGSSIPGEVRGRISDLTNAQNYGNATFGYGVAVTPLQLAMAYSVLANGGTLLRPRIIDAIVANNGTLLEQTPVRPVRRVIKEKTARGMCLALEQVVLKGTGRNAKVEGYRVGGKTGTAYKYSVEAGKYEKDKRSLTFAGIVPVDDPKFVCVVTFDEPKVDPEKTPLAGGTIAAPVFATVAERLADFMELPREQEIPAPE